MPDKRERKSMALHDMQVPVRGGTRGTTCAGAVLETHGIGEAAVLIWPRIGTYR
jgi:hypothetical protein